MSAHRGWMLLCFAAVFTLHPLEPHGSQDPQDPPRALARHTRPLQQSIAWKEAAPAPAPGPGATWQVVRRDPRPRATPGPGEALLTPGFRF